MKNIDPALPSTADPALGNREVSRLRDLSPQQWRLRSRRLARLVVRRPGHAPVHPGGHRFCGRVDAVRQEGFPGRTVQFLDPGGLPDWLGFGRWFLRPIGRSPGTEPGSRTDHFDLLTLYGSVFFRKRGGTFWSFDFWPPWGSAASGPWEPRFSRRPGRAAGGPESRPCFRQPVNCGAILAGGVVYLLSGYSPHYVFLTGVLPALLVFWICSRVSEPEEWSRARKRSGDAVPGILDLFRGPIRRLTILILLVCAFLLDGPLGLSVLVCPALAKPAGIPAVGPGSAQQICEHRDDMGPRDLDRRQLRGHRAGTLHGLSTGYRPAAALAYALTMMGTYCVPRRPRACGSGWGPSASVKESSPCLPCTCRLFFPPCYAPPVLVFATT